MICHSTLCGWGSRETCTRQTLPKRRVSRDQLQNMADTRAARRDKLQRNC